MLATVLKNFSLFHRVKSITRPTEEEENDKNYFKNILDCLNYAINFNLTSSRMIATH